MNLLNKRISQLTIWPKSKIPFTVGFCNYSRGDTYIDTQLYTHQTPLSIKIQGIWNFFTSLHIAVSASVWRLQKAPDWAQLLTGAFPSWYLSLICPVFCTLTLLDLVGCFNKTNKKWLDTVVSAMLWLIRWWSVKSQARSFPRQVILWFCKLMSPLGVLGLICFSSPTLSLQTLSTGSSLH